MTTQEAMSGGFDFGRILQNTFKVIGSNAMLFGVGALVLVSAPIFAGTLVSLQFASSPMFAAWIVGGSLLSGVGNFVLQGIVVRAAVTGLNGAPVPASEAISTGLRFFLPLLGMAIVSALGIWLGMILLIVPGIILSILWSVAAPALVVEQKGVFAALQRSRDLTRGNRWAIFGLFVLYVIASFILGMVNQAVGLPLGIASGNAFGLADTALSPAIAIFVLVSALVSGVQGVVAAAGVASLYYELRVSKEGAAPDLTAAVFD